ncbi:unnamed protein product [Owenia fusiformis]|uniref:Swi5-dependent recombination DNA repair protein 1 homolog n=1 Tax=Owenia fusiformis TaxID=6347 RepID=A0A8J1T7R7_OWEFU|nr:unnamed protein product [Owenia fusiformis]
MSDLIKAGTPVSAGRQMSASLRERLKRTSRYFKSPSNVISPACNSSNVSRCSDRSIEPALGVPTSKCNTTNTTKGDIAPVEHSPYGTKRARKSPRVNKTLSFDTCNSEQKTKQDIPNTELTSNKNAVIQVTKDIINEQANTNKVPGQKARSNLNQEHSPIYSAESRLNCDKTSDIKDVIQLRKQKAEIQTRIKEKEEKLRKLQMVKMYRSKNDLTHMQGLVDKWKTVSQDALLELHTMATEPKPSLTNIVDHFNLDHETVGYDKEEESFDS